MTLLWADGFDARRNGLNGAYLFYSGTVADITTGVAGRPLSGPYALGANSTSVSFYRPLGTSYSTLAVGVAVRLNQTNTNGYHPLISFHDGSGNPFYGVGYHMGRMYGGNNAWYYNFSPNTNASSYISMNGNQWTYIEAKITFASTNAGSVEIKRNGTVVLTQTGINTNSIASASGAGLTFGYSGLSPCYFDDWYITDGNYLGDIRVLSALPSGNGTNSQFVGSDGNSTDNYLLVDENPPSAVDYTGSQTVGDKDTYAFSDISTGWSTVHGVIMNPYVAKSDVGTISGRAIALLGGNTAIGADVPLSTTYAVAPTVLIAKPGGGAWTVADVNNTEFGWEVRG